MKMAMWTTTTNWRSKPLDLQLKVRTRSIAAIVDILIGDYSCSQNSSNVQGSNFLTPIIFAVIP
jgi:hypothetical protein